MWVNVNVIGLWNSQIIRVSFSEHGFQPRCEYGHLLSSPQSNILFFSCLLVLYIIICMLPFQLGSSICWSQIALLSWGLLLRGHYGWGQRSCCWTIGWTYYEPLLLFGQVLFFLFFAFFLLSPSLTQYYSLQSIRHLVVTWRLPRDWIRSSTLV